MVDKHKCEGPDIAKFVKIGNVIRGSIMMNIHIFVIKHITITNI